jgi:hypothetical protein
MKQSIKIISLLFYFCFFLSSCKKNLNDGNDSIYRGKKTFETWEIEMWADTNKAIVDTSIVFTARCKPLFTGKGRISITGRGALIPSGWIIESPVNDTLTRPEDDFKVISLPIDFRAREVIDFHWRIKLLNKTSYSFESMARFDSVYIQDSSKYYYIKSEQVRSIYGLLDEGPASSRQFTIYP